MGYLVSLPPITFNAIKRLQALIPDKEKKIAVIQTIHHVCLMGMVLLLSENKANFLLVEK